MYSKILHYFKESLLHLFKVFFCGIAQTQKGFYFILIIISTITQHSNKLKIKKTVNVYTRTIIYIDVSHVMGKQITRAAVLIYF